MTTQEIKSVAINAMLADLIRRGIPVQDAFDLVMGKGAYAKFAGELYDALRAKGGAS